MQQRPDLRGAPYGTVVLVGPELRYDRTSHMWQTERWSEFGIGHERVESAYPEWWALSHPRLTRVCRAELLPGGSYSLTRDGLFIGVLEHAEGVEYQFYITIDHVPAGAYTGHVATLGAEDLFEATAEAVRYWERWMLTLATTDLEKEQFVERVLGPQLLSELAYQTDCDELPPCLLDIPIDMVDATSVVSLINRWYPVHPAGLAERLPSPWLLRCGRVAVQVTEGPLGLPVIKPDEAIHVPGIGLPIVDPRWKERNAEDLVQDEVWWMTRIAEAAELAATAEKVDAAELDRLVAYLQENPEEHDQGHWGRWTVDCGSTLCAAGTYSAWLASQRGDDLIWTAGVTGDPEHASYLVAVKTETGEARIAEYAASGLGLSFELANRMFLDAGNIDQVRAAAELAKAVSL